VDHLYVPGGLEWETERRSRVEGIPRNAATLAGVLEAATRLGVDPSPIG